jgi:hypothetical protein
MTMSRKKSRDVRRLLPGRGPLGPTTKKFVMASIMVLLKANSIIK